MSNNVQQNYLYELPFFNQSPYDIEMLFSSAKLQIIEKMNSNGLLEFIKENEFYSLCNPYESLSCSYYDEDGFKYKRYDNEQHLNIFSMNIRSLPKHGGELLVFLQSLETKFDVIVLTEIGARNIGTVEHLLPNYDFYYTLPRENFYGGVGMYVSKSIGSIQTIDDLNFTKTCQCSKCAVETLYIRFDYGKRSYILGGMYRHPNGNIKHFIDDWESTLTKIDNRRTAIFVGYQYRPHQIRK